MVILFFMSALDTEYIPMKLFYQTVIHLIAFLRFVVYIPQALYLMLTTMEKRYIKISILLLPFVLYTAVMLKMIDNACQSDILQTPANPNGQRYEDTANRNSTRLLHSVIKKYEAIEIQRTKLLEQLNNLISSSPPGAISSNDLAFRYFNARNLREIKEFDHVVSLNPGTNLQKPKYLFSCSNIHNIKLIKKVGHGVSKQAFLGKYNGHSVAVKMVTRHQKEVRTCIEGMRETPEDKEFQRSRCFVFPTMKLMKEILLLEQLDHPGFVQLLGYCVRSEESDSTDMTEHGVIAIYEYGERLILESLNFLPIDEKVTNALNLAKFLHYLEHSPLGSLRVKDFKEGHFLLVNDTLKMIDLDDVDNIEPSCDIYSEIGSVTQELDPRYRTCDHDIHCHMGLCMGYNAKQNMKSMNKLFFKRLLNPLSFPSELTDAVVEINARLDALTVNSEQLIDFFRKTLSHLKEHHI